MAPYLLIALGVYLAACYVYGIYVLFRLWRAKSVSRATSTLEPADLARAARIALPDQDEAEQSQDTRIAA